MNRRPVIISAVLTLLSIPVVLVTIDTVTFNASNRSNSAFVSSGQKREYLLYVPRSYDRAKPTSLVISMHGAGGWPAQQMKLSGWNRLADAHGFIVVYPSAAEGVGPRIWHVDRGGGLERDVRFISALIDTVRASYNIDTSKIYANGISNGGGMTFVLSCRLGDRIAAFGMVAAAQTLPWSWCPDRRPAPMMAFHGTGDHMIPYRGGTSWIAQSGFPNIVTWTKSWARRNQCGERPADSVIAADVIRRAYSECKDNATVVLFTINGGGHTWPGGTPMPEWWVGRTSNGVDATSEQWKFFLKHPLSRSAKPH